MGAMVTGFDCTGNEEDVSVCRSSFGTCPSGREVTVNCSKYTGLLMYHHRYKEVSWIDANVINNTSLQ